MKNVTDLEVYSHKVYLELCLEMVKDVRHYLQQQHYDLAQEQIDDILQTFDDKVSEMAADQPIVRYIK